MIEASMTPDELKAARTTLGFTQAKLAKVLQVTHFTVSRWESGLLPIDERTRLAIEHLSCRRYKKSSKGRT
jgi:DNA-binding transcriptional regulator YiaG